MLVNTDKNCLLFTKTYCYIVSHQLPYARLENHYGEKASYKCIHRGIFARAQSLYLRLCQPQHSLAHMTLTSYTTPILQPYELMYLTENVDVPFFKVCSIACSFQQRKLTFL